MGGQEGAPGTRAVTDVQRAFRLGWRFAQIYQSLPPASRSSATPDEPSAYLPEVSELDPYDQGQLLISQIGHDADVLVSRCEPDEDGNKVRVPTKEIIFEARAEGGNAAKRRKILEAYRDLRVELGAIDPHVGAALELGRMLADVGLMPDTNSDRSVLLIRFNESRISRIYNWLDDLHTSFPKHAADAVKGSLQIWQTWVRKTEGIVTDREPQVAMQILRHQGEIWRRILCGEVHPNDLLTSESYRQAAAQLLGRLRSIARSFLARWWVVLVPLGLLVGLVTWLIIYYSPGAVVAIAALIATGAGALGVSWKTIASTLGKVTSKAEGPLWDTEVLQALIVEATITPENAKSRRVALSTREAEPVPSLPPAPAPSASVTPS